MNAENIRQNEGVDIFNLIRIIWAGKYWILGAGLVSGILSAAMVMTLPNVYMAEAVLAPVSDNKQGKLASLAGKISGIAGIGGFDISGGNGIDISVLGIETLKSRAFLTGFIDRHQLLVPLMAAKSWNIHNQEWEYDPKLYDPVEKKWVREVGSSMASEPSDLEAYEVFRRNIEIYQDKKTQIVRLSVESLSPFHAKEWAELLVKDLNDYMRAKDVDEATRSIAYLNKLAESTAFAQMQTMLFGLIEEQTKTIMLASVREGYAFQMVDPPVVPERKISPRRGVIVAIAVFFSMMCVALFWFFLVVAKKRLL
jgi:uncharacterized protein involved in exopolysaccharide biosynthesis